MHEQSTGDNAANEEEAPRKSKKRTFQEISNDVEAGSQTAATTRRETRSQTAKRAKISGSDPTHQLNNTQENLAHAQDITSSSCDNEAYTPTLTLLHFTNLSALDTNPETNALTLALINHTLTPANWHPGLSGMVQPAACFLVASLLSRRQNLVEDIAASVEVFGIGYENLVEGYRLLWEWREGLREVVWRYGELLEELPEPRLLLGDLGRGGDGKDLFGCEYEGNGADAWHERPEPERWVEE